MTFRGRTVIPGNLRGEALVSRWELDVLATFKKSLLGRKKRAIGSDIHNMDVYLSNLSGKILCLPRTVGPTTAGVILQTTAAMGISPAAMLFSQRVDSSAAAGVIMASIWNDTAIITVDGLGRDFLDTVQTGMILQIKEDGQVILSLD